MYTYGMKIECLKEKLSEAVSRTEKVSSKNATLPVLKCLLFNADKNSLQIRATNLDVGVECTLPIKVEESGTVAVLGGVLSSFLNNLGNSKTIKIETDGDGSVKVSSEKTTTTIKTLNAEDFPGLPNVENPIVFDIPAADFVDGLKSVWYSSATTSIKPELSSVRVYKDGGDLVFVATDGFRLAEKKIKAKSLPDFSHILIPVKNVGEIIRLLEGVSGDASIAVDQGQIEIRIDTMRIVSRTIDGVFPDYRAIIPNAYATEAKILKQDLLHTLKLSNLFSDSFNQINFAVSKDGKRIDTASKNKDLGEHHSSIDAGVTGEDIAVQFNFKYLNDCLSSMKGDSVTFSFAGKGRPIVITSLTDKSFLYLMMPMNG
jgi:DNA polymerase-3 subunit beta